MKKLVRIVAVLMFALFAALPSTASYPGYYYCDIPSDCPEFRDCFVTSCVNHTCIYDCWW